MKRVGAFMLCMAAGLAQAQACLPAGDDKSTKASPPYVTYNANGMCWRWYCYGQEIRVLTACGTWAQMHLVGGRVQTIQKAADPLKSMLDAPKRFTVVPLSDPSMAGMPK
jgi:hypothetical protein